MAVVSHYNVQPVVDIYGAVQGRDLGGVSRRHRRRSSTPAGRRCRAASQLMVRGQIETMRIVVRGPAGAAWRFAIVLVYLLIVVNFQSWLDPFIIISALPAALAGHRLDAVPHAHHAQRAGADRRDHVHGRGHGQQHPGGELREGRSRARPATRVDGGAGRRFTRFRPVLMTALAMIIGMMPMALGLGEGGEQNAPLGRAVIGGLMLATVATLFFVPAVFALLHRPRGTATAPGAAGLGGTAIDAAGGGVMDAGDRRRGQRASR